MSDEVCRLYTLVAPPALSIRVPSPTDIEPELSRIMSRIGKAAHLPH